MNTLNTQNQKEKICAERLKDMILFQARLAPGDGPQEP